MENFTLIFHIFIITFGKSLWLHVIQHSLVFFLFKMDPSREGDAADSSRLTVEAQVIAAQGSPTPPQQASSQSESATSTDDSMKTAGDQSTSTTDLDAAYSQPSTADSRQTTEKDDAVTSATTPSPADSQAKADVTKKSSDGDEEQVEPPKESGKPESAADSQQTTDAASRSETIEDETVKKDSGKPDAADSQQTTKEGEKSSEMSYSEGADSRSFLEGSKDDDKTNLQEEKEADSELAYQQALYANEGEALAAAAAQSLKSQKRVDHLEELEQEMLQKALAKSLADVQIEYTVSFSCVPTFPMVIVFHPLLFFLW